MNVLVCGAAGSIGVAVCDALAWRGHRVVRGMRRPEADADLAFDFGAQTAPEAWAVRLRDARVDAVVNVVGILVESASSSFARVHRDGPLELFAGARLAAVRRIVHVTALGVEHGASSPYLRSKRESETGLQALGLDAAIVRPSLVVGPDSESARLFATLAALPVIGLPGRGRQEVQPIHVLEVAEAIVALVERSGSASGVYELAGGSVVDYRTMLDAYRRAQRLGRALWLPVPMPLMAATARLAERLPQRVFSRDTVAMLRRGNVASRNAAATLLGRPPSTLDEALAATPLSPRLDTRVALAPVLERALRVAIGFLWLYTATVSAAMPVASGVVDLLARCGFTGNAGTVALVGSCVLNATLGALTLLRPGVSLYAVQAMAIVGYTATAAFCVPQLTIDHCGPLAKNIPLLAAVLALWLAEASRPATRPRETREGPAQTSMFATRNALVSMKARRGSTSSPISIVNTRSASMASSS